VRQSVLQMKRPVRRRLKKVVQSHADADYRRRANALLALSEGNSVSEVARQVQASRTSVRRWRKRYERFGEEGLVPLQRGRPVETVTEELCAKLLELIEEEPMGSDYLNSNWTSEMLAEQLRERLEVFIHSSTVRRLLPRLGVVWKRARPTLCIRDPKKACRMKAIENALEQQSADHPVFYVDEVDIDLNPRIGFAWSKKGKQMTVPTPGKNEKRYLAGALNASNGKVTWVEWPKKPWA
jgi:transposase